MTQFPSLSVPLLSFVGFSESKCLCGNQEAPTCVSFLGIGFVRIYFGFCILFVVDALSGCRS